ncbi:RNHCP domain-containing protein [Nocardiopsis alba]|uniref:RNHCP domain-containing protein n=1 Tax=Nocardiopsis alba TaxID=53437 RepID=UPI0033B1C67E
MGRRSDRGGRRPQRPKTSLRSHGDRGRRHGPTAESFRCLECRLDVSTRAPGTAHRNHCPNCLASRHVDGRLPGDRSAGCGGRMTAVGMTARSDGEWMLVHRCVSCGGLGTNRVAGDDNVRALVRLAVRPLSDPTLTRSLLTRL